MSRRPYIKELPRAYREEYDAQIAADEPVIEWVKNNHGIWVHVSIHDPHVDSAHNAEKTSCKRGHEFTEANTIVTRDGRQCRKCKNRDRKPLTPEQKQRANEVRNRWRQRLRDEQRTNPECTDAALLAAARTDI